MRFSLVFFICAMMAMLFGFLMEIPAALDWLDGQIQSAFNFMACGLFIFTIGALGGVFSYRSWDRPNIKEMFVITSSIWFTISFFAALPFYFSEPHFSFTNAFFESVSGFTGTGATIFAHLENLPRGLLLWRAMTQWIGGIGIVILAITILPVLHIGGMQLFATENSDNSAKDSPFVASKMKALLLTYLLLSVLCAGALYFSGMSLFDAIAHMMTTVSTGGFSTYDDSIGHFIHSPAMQWVLIVFMVIGSLPLVFVLAFLQRQWDRILQDEQVKTFLLLVLLLAVSVCLGMWYFMPAFSNLEETIRLFTFQLVSIISTTGFVIGNYEAWGAFFIAFFLFLTVVGGCTGSTSGGIKIFRFNILYKTVKRHLLLMLTPHAVIIPRYNNKPVTDEITIGVFSFLSLFFSVLILSTLCLTLTGLDFMTAFSGSLTCISNVGPGMGHLIGPDKTFALLPDAAKWILSIVMLLGRLEFIAITVLLLPQLWKRR